MNKMSQGLEKLGWSAQKTKGTMYLWAAYPDSLKKMGSLKICENLLKETGVVLSPGVGFGKYGEGYVRISLVTHDRRFHDALLRISQFTKKYKK
jgi:aspartate/methionine/tyrosine aminotransferase